MAGDFDAVPGAEIKEDLPLGFLDFFLQLGGFLLKIDVEGVSLCVLLQLGEFVLQLNYGFFEIELISHVRQKVAILRIFAMLNVPCTPKEPDMTSGS
jgi:hypothetical protein